MPAAFNFEHMGVGTLLKNGRHSVPPNQRPYAWTKQQVNDLLFDLQEAISNNDSDYFLGTIVLTRSSSTPLIADGQQRMATTSILVARIRDRLNNLGATAQSHQIDSDYLREVDLKTGNPVLKLKMNLEDHNYFKEVILASPDEQVVGFSIQARSNDLLKSASEEVDHFLSKLLSAARPENHIDLLVQWIEFIRDSATVVVVTVPDEVNAYRMFETLNDRGLKASQADLLKNYLFSRSGSRLSEAQQHWATMKARIEEIDDEDLLVTYIRHFWITQEGPTRERDLAKKIREKITNETQSVSFLSRLAEAAFDYQALFSMSHPRWSKYGDTAVKHVETITKQLQVEQIRPLLFAVIQRYTPTEASKAFKLLVSWSVRFLIVGGRGGKLDTNYSIRAQEVGSGKVTKAADLRTAMAAQVPTDEVFRDAFATARVSRTHLARYYLRAIDKTMRGDAQPTYVANEDASQINLEHVLPLVPSDAWTVDVETANVAQKRLGNMTLLPASINTRAANKSFDDKKKEFEKVDYLITKDICQYDEWGLSEIDMRQRNLADHAVQTWSLQFN